jgi:Ca-activated chloride channel family protein
MRAFFVLFCMFLFLQYAAVVNAQSNSAPVSILFLLDASGSMKGTWEGNESKFVQSLKLIHKLVDSLQSSKANISVGLRIFGHQYPKQAHNCTDSKLEIPIAQNNSNAILQLTQKISAKGYSPIAYSLYQAAQFDFENTSPTAKRAIILISDGIETCDGDICAAAQIFESKKIALKPYVLGINIPDSIARKYKCVGQFFDVKKTAQMTQNFKVIFSQVMNTTTAQINLLNEKQLATETDAEITITDAYTQKLNYAFVHTFNAANQPDTLVVDPVGKYNITVHTIPPQFKNDVTFSAGQHNIVGIPSPQGLLDVDFATAPSQTTETAILLRKHNSPEILSVLKMGSPQKIIAGIYDLEILTLPITYQTGYVLKPSVKNTLKIPAAGILSLPSGLSGIYAIFYTNPTNTNTELIAQYSNPTNALIYLQPGKYTCVYRGLNPKKAMLTKTIPFTITSNKNTTLAQTAFL